MNYPYYVSISSPKIIDTQEQDTSNARYIIHATTIEGGIPTPNYNAKVNKVCMRPAVVGGGGLQQRGRLATRRRQLLSPVLGPCPS